MRLVHLGVHVWKAQTSHRRVPLSRRALRKIAHRRRRIEPLFYGHLTHRCIPGFGLDGRFAVGQVSSDRVLGPPSSAFPPVMRTSHQNLKRFRSKQRSVGWDPLGVVPGTAKRGWRFCPRRSPRARGDHSRPERCLNDFDIGCNYHDTASSRTGATQFPRR